MPKPVPAAGSVEFRSLPSVSAPAFRTSRGLEPVAAATTARPAIFEDIGDVLADIQQRERVVAVVRPRTPPDLARPDTEASATLAAIVLGPACSLPIVQAILWYVFDKDPLQIGPALPGYLEWIAPPRWRG